MRDAKHLQLMDQTVCCCVCGCQEARPLGAVFTLGMVKCRGCGLIYRNPPSSAEDLARAYSGDRTDFAREDRVGEQRKQQFGRFLKRAGVPGRLLDVGCGYGLFLKLAREAGWQATGVDLNVQAVTYAKTRFHVNALCGDLRDFRFQDGSVDVVTLWNVLDHVSDPIDILREVHRVLKDDGLVFIRTPNAVWHYLNLQLAHVLSRLGWDKVFRNRPHVTFIFFQTNFSRSTLWLALERSGFAPLSIRNSPPIPGDPYLGLGPIGKRLVALTKGGVYGVAQALAFSSGARLLIAPSLEAWARRGEVQKPT